MGDEQNSNSTGNGAEATQQQQSEQTGQPQSNEQPQYERPAASVPFKKSYDGNENSQ